MIYAKPELNVLAYRLSHLLDDARRNTTPGERAEVLGCVDIHARLTKIEARQRKPS
jgi:hypothetical protein